ncbi:Na+/H+ antiporter NhaC [Candidatus Formimonas warabiya]|uniref:Na+/H+ antiporter NhaC n=1 Tax=Formimonas warabiya TaxID=1761012 RepID=A0A3G1KYQ8_FORW1|nr:Na+/H+ antiporter NhaC [Candidatus Formimonas warabiya]ATW27489.1 Na+/H+ antiporter NhaC [Candidatus Formimonas warabiya]
MEKNVRPSFGIALFIFLAIIATLSIGMFVLKVDLHPLLIICILFTALICMKVGFTWENVELALCNGINRAMTSMFIFILIGMLIGSWTQSGTIPGLVYYGLGLLSPQFFLPAGFIVCSIMSFATGTCWGTGGTLGVALLGMGAGMGMPLPLVAGMVISGAYFGDKMSPVSDTNNLSTVNSGANIYGHIASMARTAIPTFIISLALYSIIGISYAGASYNAADVEAIRSTIAGKFHINIAILLPLVVLLIVSFLKVAPVPALFSGVVAGNIIAALVQGTSLHDILTCLNYGFSSETGNAVVDKIVNNGGIQDMMWTFSLAFIAVTLGGLLDDMKILEVLIEKVVVKIKSQFSLVTTTIFSSIISNAAMGENYLSSIINSRLWGRAYDKLGMQRRMLSRCVEEGANLTSALIPWTTAGAFFYGAFKINPFVYAPYAFSNYICFLMTIVLAFFGIAIVKVPAEGKKDRFYEMEQANLHRAVASGDIKFNPREIEQTPHGDVTA